MKLGLFAPIDAKPEHAEAILRNAAELAKQEQNTVTRFRFRENAITFQGFGTSPNEPGRRDHLEGCAAALIKGAQIMLASAPVIAPVELERKCATEHQLGVSPCARPCTNVPRPTWTRSTSSRRSRACGSSWSRESRLGPLRHSLALNAITADKEFIDDLGND